MRRVLVLSDRPLPPSQEVFVIESYSILQLTPLQCHIWGIADVILSIPQRALMLQIVQNQQRVTSFFFHLFHFRTFHQEHFVLNKELNNLLQPEAQKRKISLSTQLQV